MQAPLELAARAFHFDRLPIDRSRDVLRQHDGLLPDSRHVETLPFYHTTARISPPVCAARACRSVISPFEVLRIAMPSPLRTRGISLTPTYLRRPGVDTRLTSRITG